MQRDLIAICAVTVLIGAALWYAGTELVRFNTAYVAQARSAAVFFIPGISIAELQRKYSKAPRTNKQVRILLVPGHEPGAGGAQYHGTLERDLAVDLAEDLSSLLQTNFRYEVVVARDKNAWNPDLLHYFKDQAEAILTFIQQQKVETAQHVGEGRLVQHSPAMQHNTAPPDMALRLYGIHKWANESDIDVAIHIHFNDSPRKNTSRPGPYSGFTLYIPDPQYSNGTTARAVAESIFAQLSKKYAPSTMPKEAPGIVESQDLIGVGSYNTSDAPSVLIEYAYIYEPMLQDPTTRAQTLHTMAEQTFEGLQDFFENRQ